MQSGRFLFFYFYVYSIYNVCGGGVKVRGTNLETFDEASLKEIIQGFLCILS